MAFESFINTYIEPKKKKEDQKTVTKQAEQPAVPKPSDGAFSGFKSAYKLEEPKAKTPVTPASTTETKTPKQEQVESPSLSFMRQPDLSFESSRSTRSIAPTPAPAATITPSAPKVAPRVDSSGKPVPIVSMSNPINQPAPKETISAAPVDTRKPDSALAAVGRFILPGTFLEKELGIAQEQRRNPDMGVGDIVRAAGNAQTVAMLEKNPDKIDPMEYFRRGQSFGNNLDVYQRYQDAEKGYKGDVSVTDLPEPVTTKQKIMETLGQISTMAFAEPLIGEAVAGLVSKIPGGPKVLAKIAEMSAPKAIKAASDVSVKSPFIKGVVDTTVDAVKANAVSYATAIVKSAGVGSIFGLITENKKSVAENVVQTAGLFAGFTALTYPIAAFFRPIIQQVGKAEYTPNSSKAFVDPAVTQEPISRTLWFSNPKDDSQLLKVTANGVKFVPKSSAEVVAAGAEAAHPTALTKVDIEAFNVNPSPYERAKNNVYDTLKTWVDGGKPKVVEIPFTVKDNMPRGSANSFTGPSVADDVGANMTSSEVRQEITKINETMSSPNVAPEVVQQMQAKLVPLQAALNSFHNVGSQSTVSVKGEDGKPVANIKTVEYSDGTFAARIDASTPSAGITTDFAQGKTYPTEEQAVAAAKQELTTWAKETMRTVEDPQDAVALQNIVSKVEGKTPAVQELPKDNLEAEVNALIKYTEERIRSRYKNNPDRYQMNKDLKGQAMELAAVKRGIVGNSTTIELQNARQYLQSNYSGKPVEVNGVKGTVTKPSFGKIGVKFDDGTVKFVQPGQITSQKVTDKQVSEYIRSQAQKRLEGLKSLYSGFKPPEAPKPVAPVASEAPAVQTKPEAPTPKERAKIVLQDNDLHNRIMSELLFAEAGKRIAVRKIDTAGFDFSRQASTFPKWIPKELRHKKLLDAVAKHITDGTMPTKAAEVRLYDIVAQEMQAQDEVLNDAKFVENARNNLYNPFASDAENAAALAKFDEEYAKLKQQSQPASAPESGNAVQPVVEAVQSEIVLPEEKPVPVEEKVAAPAPIEPPKKPEPPKNEKMNSAVYERLKAENPELTENVTYTEQNLKDNAEKAVKLIEQDKEKAYRIAMGVEEPPANQTSTAINIALAEKALEEGNNSLYGQLVRNRSLAQTRRGQEIVAEKGSVTDNSVAKYVKALINTRLQKLGDSYLGDLSDKMLKSTKVQRAIDVIDTEVKKVKAKIKSAKELDLEDAQAFLDSLACK